MTSIKISKVHYEMLVEYCKRKRRKPVELIEEYIQVKYNEK